MKLKAWIVDAPAGGCVMQILEQDGIVNDLLSNYIKNDYFPNAFEKTIPINHMCIQICPSRTAQSVIDQITAGLAGHAVESEPKRGDLVEVWEDYSEPEPEDRIFLLTIDGSTHPHICVSEAYERDYRLGEGFLHMSWKNMRPIPQPVRYSRSGDVHTWTTEAEKAGEVSQ